MKDNTHCMRADIVFPDGSTGCFGNAMNKVINRSLDWTTGQPLVTVLCKIYGTRLWLLHVADQPNGLTCHMQFLPRLDNRPEMEFPFFYNFSRDMILLVAIV